MTTIASARRVKRLHVRAGVEDDVARATTLLSDALHTASLPAADEGRLVVIRRLALGRISAHGSPASLALHIERISREAISGAVFYDLPAAEHAPAVMFRDRGEAILALASLHARGARAYQWFWSAVIPGWSADLSRANRWTLLLDAAHALPEGPIVAGAMVDDAFRAGAEEELFRSIAPDAAIAWLQLAGWSSIEPETSYGPAAPPRLRRAGDIEQWRRRCAPGDGRVIWLATVLAVHESRSLAGDARLARVVARVLLESYRQQQSESAVTRPVSSNRSDPSSEVSAVRPAAAPPARDGSAAEKVQSRPQPQDVARQVEGGELTSHAGLLLVVPILARLGFDEYLQRYPYLLYLQFPESLVAFIGRRAGLASDDPLSLAFDGECDPRRVRGRALRDLPDAVRRVISTPQPRILVDSPYSAWLTAVRRWSRRELRMGLVSLIRRPGRVHISRTHLEAVFELSCADIRIRRLALDVDPGWVPWLGRVVRFHYVR